MPSAQVPCARERIASGRISRISSIGVQLVLPGSSSADGDALGRQRSGTPGAYRLISRDLVGLSSGQRTEFQTLLLSARGTTVTAAGDMRALGKVVEQCTHCHRTKRWGETRTLRRLTDGRKQCLLSQFVGGCRSATAPTTPSSSMHPVHWCGGALSTKARLARRPKHVSASVHIDNQSTMQRCSDDRTSLGMSADYR